MHLNGTFVSSEVCQGCRGWTPGSANYKAGFSRKVFGDGELKPKTLNP